MTLIDTTDALAAFCHRQAQARYITVDTEFIRDKTYFPQLCLIQVAGPDGAAALDPLAPGMDLAPLFELMAASTVLKVFHAARQDIEIFVNMAGAVPAPLFDTQVAAMVCGFGDSVSYETLAGKLAGAHIDKSSRFTDWSHRPLSERQLRYALTDVVPLRTVYEKLEARLAKSGRSSWLGEEMGTLTDPATYRQDPADAWRRFKVRSNNRKLLALVRELAAWRETAAQQRNLPRNRLRVLLKLRCEENDVAQKLVADTEDLEMIAADDAAPVRALQGWRGELFGKDALDLKRGRLALTASGKRIKLVRLGAAAEAAQ